MSGGHFDYQQYKIGDIRASIEKLIEDNNKPNEYDFCNKFSDEILKEFEIAISILKIAEIYVQRSDWLVSGDDGEDTFFTRLNEDLKEADL